VAQTDLVDWMLRQRTRTATATDATDARAAVSFTE
jgi:hypothetical protein